MPAQLFVLVLFLCVHVILILRAAYDSSDKRDSSATGEESSKDRFAIDENQVIQFLRGEDRPFRLIIIITHTHMMEDSKIHTSVLLYSDFDNIFNSSCPVRHIGETIRVPEKQIALRNELQKMNREMKLFPTVRVDYTRIAFNRKIMIMFALAST